MIYLDRNTDDGFGFFHVKNLICKCNNIKEFAAIITLSY